jgi:hypothetical protein
MILPTALRRAAFVVALVLPVAALTACGDPPNEKRIEDLEEQVEELTDRVEALEDRIR